MATISWISTTGGDWSVASNWQGGVVPGASDDAVMHLSATETITVSDAEPTNSVLFDDANADYIITSSGALTAQMSLELDGTAMTMDGSLTAGTDITMTVSEIIVFEGMVTAVDITLNAGSIDASTGTLIASGTLTAGPLNGATLTGLSCFALGTNIATSQADRPVETLRPGDHVTLHDGQTAAIIWIGHRHVDCRHHPAPDTVRPVRVRRGAFGHELPRRDLMLSPDHSVYVRGVLVPIRYLINGTSIVQEAWDNVEYFHVELQAHDIILAEGLPVESYLDTGHRAAFDNAGPVTHLHPRFAPAIREAFGCATLVVSGPVLDLIRHDLDQRPVPLTPETSPATWAPHRA